MTSDEFWHGDLRLCRAYREADRARKRAEDVRQWKAGAYTYRALVAACNAYRELSSAPEHPYPDVPMFTPGLSPHSAEAEEKAEMERSKAYMAAFAAQFNKQFEQD